MKLIETKAMNIFSDVKFIIFGKMAEFDFNATVHHSTVKFGSSLCFKSGYQHIKLSFVTKPYNANPKVHLNRYDR